MITLEGFSNNGYSAAATSHSINLPADIQKDEFLGIAVISNESNRTPQISGYSFKSFAMTTETSYILGVLWKIAGESEPTSETLTFVESGSGVISTSAFRLSGVDTTDPWNSNVGFKQEDPTVTLNPSIPSGSLSITSGSGILALMACEFNRSVTAYDPDFDTQIAMMPDVTSLHVYLDREVNDTTNPQYDFTINSSRRMGTALFELKVAAPTGPSIPAVTDPVEDTIVADMDNPVEVSSIEITSGIRTEVQTNWTSEALAPDDTRFTINPVDRLTLPFLGTATLRFLDNLDALIVDTSINLTAWSGWKATLLDGLTGEDIDHPESINQFRTSGTPTVDDQYMWQEITATNVQISNNDRVTFDAPGSFQLYYWDGTNETMSGPHVFEVDETGIILVRRLRIFHNGKVLDIINSMSGL